MAMHHATVRKHATPAEWAFLETSFAGAITRDHLSPARLRQQAARARKLRDKYRDVDSKAKEEMFADAVVRFESRLAQLQRKHERQVPRPKRSSGALDAKDPQQLAHATATERAVDPEAVEPGAGAPWPQEEAEAEAVAMIAQSESSRGVRQQQRLSHQSGLAHQAHVGSRGRRNQGLRDSR